MGQPEVIFLHALPLDGSMWAAQRAALPSESHSPTLYGFGDRLEDWARGALQQAVGDRLIVVGCSIGGSCAIEVAAIAPERVAALVLIGTKARHRADPEQHRTALAMLSKPPEAWQALWAPLFGMRTNPAVIAGARQTMLAQPAGSLMRGVTAFHTRPDRNGFLAKFPGPAIVMTGAEDRMPGPEISAQQALSAPLGALHVVPDCGHYLPLEKPDYLNAVLARLIAEL